MKPVDKSLEAKANKILCGDTVEELRNLPDNCIDLIFADPPYNLQLKGEFNEAIIAHEIIKKDYRTSVLFQESQKEKARLEGLIVE